jgi:phytoene synthase
MTPFADASDDEQCRRIHRKFGTTYYYATRHFPKSIRRRVHALYAFVRIPDEWVDNPGNVPLRETLAAMDQWRSDLVKAYAGHRSDHFAMRAFADVALECQIPIEEPLLFLDAMQMDLTKNRYETYEDLRGYMRGSAAAVGLMMCSVMGAKLDREIVERATCLGEAMQLTNFLRDVGEDADRNRIYIPLEDLDAYKVPIQQILSKQFSKELYELMRFQVCRAKKLYYRSDPGLSMLPPSARRPVLLARLLYAAILDKLQEQDLNPFIRRARTTSLEKLRSGLHVALAGNRLVQNLVAVPKGWPSVVASAGRKSAG